MLSVEESDCPKKTSRHRRHSCGGWGTEVVELMVVPVEEALARRECC